ncbi:MAG: nucleotidyltransferase domain-containing protein [Patescibacteria group bacterium]|nr:nucleotidyltransferase domain-containing protein [Patescibacteria group bacterium]
MTDRVHFHPNLIFSPGTQVVAMRDGVHAGGKVLHPRGAVGVVVRSPGEQRHGYLVRFPDGVEETFAQREFILLNKYKEGQIGDSEVAARQCNLYERVIYRCVIGSRAYGLDDSESDTDWRGVYLPPADLHWSLYGVPEQLENDATEEAEIHDREQHPMLAAIMWPIARQTPRLRPGG